MRISEWSADVCSADLKASAPKAGERPQTQARVQIVSPTPNQETGPAVTVKVNLIGARAVPQVTGPLKPDEGHIHIATNQPVVAMSSEERSLGKRGPDRVEPGGPRSHQNKNHKI